MSDGAEQVLVGSVHLPNIFWVFGHFNHQRLQPSSQSCNLTRHIVGNPQLDPGHIDGKEALINASSAS